MKESGLGDAQPSSDRVRIRSFTDSLRTYCESCTHSRFIHSDDGSRCLYSECECSRFEDPKAASVNLV